MEPVIATHHHKIRKNEVIIQTETQNIMTSLPVTSINIYPDLMHEEDLTPDCGVEIDAIVEEIHAAVDGWGCDKSRLVAALGSTSPEDRLKITLRYKDLHEKNLKDS